MLMFTFFLHSDLQQTQFQRCCAIIKSLIQLKSQFQNGHLKLDSRQRLRYGSHEIENGWKEPIDMQMHF